jgi:O-antigen/teichoic acid export membrane protein
MGKLVNIGLNVFRGAVIPALNFLVVILGIKIHGKEAWGTLINIIIWISLMVFVLNWGNKDYLIRKYSKEPSRVYTTFYSNLFSRSLLLFISPVLLFLVPLPIALSGILLVALMHFYTSLESLIIYHQKFKAQLFSEIIGFSIIIIGIFGFASFSLLQFLQLYCLSVLIKLVYMFLALRLWKEKITFAISLKQFSYSLPFFILGLSGMINSKIDLYLVNMFLPIDKISDYQLLTSAFLMLQALSVFITSPLNKTFYRSGNQTIEKLGSLFKKLAIPFVLIGSLFIWVILEKWVQLGLDLNLYIIGLLASLPAFYYVIPILNLYKKHQEKKVLRFNIITAVFNTVVSLLLLPKFGILGVLISVCVSQWVYLFMILKYEK